MSATVPEPISPFSAADEAARDIDRPLPVQCRVVASERERSLHLRIRHEIFVREERLFDETDYDQWDEAAGTRQVIGLYRVVAAGAVRLYPLQEPGLWKGDRLAVLPKFRSHLIGPRLVRFAVKTAAEAGGQAMIAYVLPQNVRLFERLGWHPLGKPVTYVGQSHQKVKIDLAAATFS